FLRVLEDVECMDLAPLHGDEVDGSGATPRQSPAGWIDAGESPDRPWVRAHAAICARSTPSSAYSGVACRRTDAGDSPTRSFSAAQRTSAARSGSTSTVCEGFCSAATVTAPATPIAHPAITTAAMRRPRPWMSV